LPKQSNQSFYQQFQPKVMKSVYFSLFFALTLLFACKNETSKPVVQAPAPTPPPVAAPAPVAPSPTSCYVMNVGKDITAVELTTIGEAVTGYYAWEPFEKDGGRGSLKGTKTGDVITAIFQYMIEGSIQSEEVMFKLEGDKLMQASAPLDDVKGVSVIKDKTKIDWTKEVFATVDCAKVKTSIDNAKEITTLIMKSKKK
jgi:hypothetical protein